MRSAKGRSASSACSATAPFAFRNQDQLDGKVLAIGTDVRLRLLMPTIAAR
jgi:hypothetical protein